MDQFPRENYAEYEDEVALWVNEDTSLKPHERYVLDAGEMGYNGCNGKQKRQKRSIPSM